MMSVMILALIIIKKWIVDYVVGNTYKVKYVEAKTNTEAIKKGKSKKHCGFKPSR